MDRLDDTTHFGGTLSFTHSTDSFLVPLQTHPVDTALNILTALWVSLLLVMFPHTVDQHSDPNSPWWGQ